MKLIHLSDLHLGKRLKERSLLEDQAYILEEILGIVGREAPDGVILAGDVYDKAVPSAEAVSLLDDFLFRLARRTPEVFIISGNHDSAERLAFGGRLMETAGVHLAPVYDGNVTPVELRDGFGPVRVYMLPFVKPAHVRRYCGEDITTYTEALAAAIGRMAPDPAVRNVLVTHQFVTGAVTSDSEEVSVGGLDNVDASVFEPFDYVALGHIHSPQWVSRETIRYCGTPLKYSFSEREQVKSVTVVELGEKGAVTIRTTPLVPKRDLRQIRGTYEELTARENYEGTDREDYIRAVLTDENDVRNAVGRLRAVYPNLLELEYDNARTRSAGGPGWAEAVERKSELDLLGELYEKQNGMPMSDEQRAWAAGLFERIREEEA